MKGLIYETFQGPLHLRDLPDPVPGPHGVIVRVEATGLCRSDWHGWMGHDPDIRLPHVPGHELAGTILETGREVRNFQKGDRVTVPFVCGCGRCWQCLSGNHQICDHQSQPGFTHWGSFAEFVAIEYADVNLVALPDEIDMVTAATLGCRFITAFRAVLDQGRVSGGQFVSIHGCGGVGLSAVMIASALGAEVIAVDIREESLELARDLGAAHILNASRAADIPSQIRDLTSGGAHVSLDALGSPVTCINSITSLRKRGRHVQVGLINGSPEIPMDLVVARELEILGSHGMQAYRYEEMLRMISKGKLAPSRLIQKRISLEEGALALPAMDRFEHRGVSVIDTF
ncbi:MAG: zinc-dependent alcohol dehydrogenase family protein [Robiginitalea sp.]